MMAESSASGGLEKPKIQKPEFKPLSPAEMSEGLVQSLAVDIPKHRFTPLKKAWLHEPRHQFDIYPLVYDVMKIDLCMFPNKRKVVLKTRSDTPDITHLQKCAAFLTAFMKGFDAKDAVAILRCDEIVLDKVNIPEVKPSLKGEHLSRAIGRVAGKQGKTKFTIENATNTRIVIAGEDIHIMGAHLNLKVARDMICRLILGSPAGTVYSKLRAVSARLAECR